MTLRPVARIGVLILAGAAVGAQQRPPSPEPAFDIASIKPTANDAVESISVQPDGVRFSGFHVRTLITIAYKAEGIQRFDQLVGGPSWIAVERFDVAAKSIGAAQETMNTRLPAMLRTLLRDRFRLDWSTHPRSGDLPTRQPTPARVSSPHSPSNWA